MSFARADLLLDASCSSSARFFASCSSFSFHSLASFSLFFFFFRLHENKMADTDANMKT